MLCTVLASMIWFCDCVIIEVIVCQYCWRWTGFSFGFDLLVSLTGRWVAYVAKHCLFVYVSAVLSTSDVWQCLCGLVSDGLYFMLLLQNCCHIWWRHCVCVEDTKIALLLVAFYLLLIPFCRKNLHLLLLSGNKCNRLVTLTQCVEWSQFVGDYFSFNNLTYFTGGFRSWNISHNNMLW